MPMPLRRIVTIHASGKNRLTTQTARLPCLRRTHIRPFARSYDHSGCNPSRSNHTTPDTCAHVLGLIPNFRIWDNPEFFYHRRHRYNEPDYPHSSYLPKMSFFTHTIAYDALFC